ncbi:polyketide synthase [Flagelloscypha sp. PMI_526]|nr:polyketide synthase [Flagelloscypha sp. PMI_526]
MKKPIALVGISVEFPSGRHSHKNLNHDEFYDFILNKLDSYEKVPTERFNIDAWTGEGPGKVCTDQGTFLKDVTSFDPLEFGISARDAKAMALSTRKLIEQANVGCFTSGALFDMLNMVDPHEFDAKGSIAGAACMIANKVSYHLDLLGPSIPLDTACSSTLTGLHQAVQALCMGDCEAAVVAGCQVNPRYLDWISYSESSILSPDGKCKPFDATANGFSRGEGVAAIVVKPLEDALRDGDKIYATILGTGVSGNGSAAPPSAPVADGQREAMIRCFHGLNYKPEDVDFVEMHATGTAAGDPTEANWVGNEFKRQGDLYVGSVKGNTGHQEITAFLASLSKAPTTPISLQEIQSAPKALISICSSGIGGVNGHALVQQPPIPEPSKIEVLFPNGPLLVVAGGLSPRSAATVAADIDAHIETEPDELLELATLHARRVRGMTWRTFSLRLPSGEIHTPFCDPILAPRTKSPIVFVIGGQGTQHIHMGRNLYHSSSVFRESIETLDIVYQKIRGRSLLQESGLFHSKTFASPTPEISDISIALPSLAMIQIALIDLLKHCGIEADYVIGHSAGETVMLYASSAASRELVLELAIARGDAMTLVSECGGTMAALGCSAAVAKDLIDLSTSESRNVDIACYNSPDAVTISGHSDVIDKVILEATKRDIFARKLRTRTPVHSSLMDVCRERYLSLVQAVFDRHGYPNGCTPQKPVYSTVSGSLWEGPFDATYFWQNARQAVRFHDAISALQRSCPIPLCIEVAPHPALTGYLSQLGIPSSRILSPMKRQKQYSSPHDELVTFLGTIGRLVQAGCNSVKFEALTGKHFSKIDIGLAAYPFAPKDVPIYPEGSPIVTIQYKPREKALEKEIQKLSAKTHPDLAQHLIAHEPMFERGATALSNVEFRTMLPFSRTRPLVVSSHINGPVFSITSHIADEERRAPPVERVHAKGLVDFRVLPSNRFVDVTQLEDSHVPCDISDFYASLTHFAQYGPVYQRLVAWSRGSNSALVTVRAFEEDLMNYDDYILHPAILDACLHVLVHPAFSGHMDRNVYFLPSRIQHVQLFEGSTGFGKATRVSMHCIFSEWHPEHWTVDCTIFSCDTGLILCQIRGLQLAKHYITFPSLDIPKAFDMVRENATDTFVWDPQATAHNPVSYRVIHFRYRQELSVRHAIKDILRTPGIDIWVVASEGVDASACRGFTRCLRKEIVDGRRLVMVTFRSTWDWSNNQAFLSQLSEHKFSGLELEITPTGQVITPRLRAFPELPTQGFEPNRYWQLRGSKLLHPVLNLPKDEDHVVLKVYAGFKVSDHMWTFIGQSNGESSWTYGISTSHLSNYLCVPRIQTSSLDVQNLSLLAVLPGMLVLALAARGAILEHPGKYNARSVVIIDDGSPVALSTKDALSLLGVCYLVLSPQSLVTHLDDLADCRVLLTGSSQSEELQTLQQACPRGIIYPWNDIHQGLQVLVDRDNALFTHAFAALLPKLDKVPSELSKLCADPVTQIPSSVQVASTALFDPEKVYILIGGIGSLGIHCALWMYQNGARRLVLTSRSGRASLTRGNNMLARRVLGFLETLHDLDLKLEKCDATSYTETRDLMAPLSKQLGGFILLSVVLDDHLFLDGHTEETYYTPFGPKVEALKNLDKLDLSSECDFVVAISSVAGLGNVGQTNYASANTILEDMLASRPNAFSLVAPAVVDSATIAGTDDLMTDLRLGHWAAVAMSSEDVCQMIGHGLKRLRVQNFSLYVPELKWYELARDFGGSPLFDHLVDSSRPSQVSTLDIDDIETKIRDVVLESIDVDESEFVKELPLTSYGLDSLSAGRLSQALKNFVTISQLQLLGDMSLVDILGFTEKKGDH